MKFDDLIAIVGEEPVFTSGLLKAGDVDPTDLSSQLSRWTASGRVVQLRRGVYAMGESYRRREPHAFEIANLLVAPSYVSLESALSYHGMIPEAVFVTTSISTRRPAAYETALGRFDYRYVSPDLFWGYQSVKLAPWGAHTALVARPEKALLDLVHLRHGGDDPAFLRQLRLERLDELDLDLLAQYARESGKPKLIRAAKRLGEMAAVYRREWSEL